MIAFHQRRDFFYGWVVVAATFAVTFVGFGSAYTFSAFIEALQRDLGASRGSISLVFSTAGFLYFSLGVISGPLADRFGARSLCVVGMALVGLGLALAGQARTIAEAYAAYGLGIGLGVGCAYVPALGAVQRWFVARRGLASGLAVSGIGFGTLIMPPLATWLISTLGWRGAYLVLGGAAAAVGVGASLLLEDDPGQRGLRPDGATDEPGIESSAAKEGVSVKDAIRTPRFLGMYVACLLSAVGVFVPFIHLVPFAVDHQIAPAVAVLLLSVIGVGSTAGRFCLGGLADRLGRDTFLVIMYAGIAVSLAIWASSAGSWALAAFALLFGLFYGGWVAVLPAVVADHFGRRNVGGIIGLLYTSVAIGTLIGPSLAGFIYDASNSYFSAIVISGGANAVAALVAFVTSGLPRHILHDDQMNCS
ncbi:MFS transporter [Ensifer sp. ENS12]|uniref:MFS transporter n=1 Tax=Ensifer sp. ENS12 TaxID=2854774 RepID=UPI000DE5A0F3|nr:MFS transporter [Ensifer sp. ENS12]MBV7522547.1 MFS transporter [Ensifer sp. ENS12]